MSMGSGPGASWDGRDVSESASEQDAQIRNARGSRALKPKPIGILGALPEEAVSDPP